MLARELLSLHAAPHSVPKTPASKPCSSIITSKLIQTKAFQVFYPGHLRKTGGRGSNQLCDEISGSLLPLPFANLSALRASALACLFSCPDLSPSVLLANYCFFSQLFCFALLTQKQGCTPAKMSARRHFLSLFFHSPLGPLAFQLLTNSFIFSVSHLSRILPTPSALPRTARLGTRPLHRSSPTSHQSRITSLPWSWSNGSPSYPVDTQTSALPEIAACSGDASTFSGRRRGWRLATVGLGRRGGRGGRGRRDGRGRIFRSGEIYQRRSL